MKPVYYRERKSELYGIPAYYFGTLLSAMTIMAYYPILINSLVYHFIEFDDTSSSAIAIWISALSLHCLVGLSYGLFFGAVFEHENSAIQLLNLSTLIFNMGGGTFANVGGDSSWFQKFISYISPMRYTGEILLRRLI